MKIEYKKLPSYMDTSKKFRSLVLRIAHSIKKQNGFTFGTAQSKAWKVAKLIANLSSEGFTNFAFQKISTGEIRPAIGTRNLKNIPINKHPKKSKEQSLNIKAIPYFDANKGEWRSFKPHTLLSNAS